MIERISAADQLDGFEVNDIFSVRIFSLLGAYGCKYPFAVFYRQLDDGGNITAVISSLDGDFTVSVRDDSADIDEIADFLRTVGFKSVLCGEINGISEIFTQGAVMVTSKSFELFADAGCVDPYPNLFDLYNFLDYTDGSFDAWYIDLNHRIRHGYARAYALKVNGETVSSAVLSSIYGDNAVLSAVRTGEDKRGFGYGSSLVCAVCSDFGGKVYLMREKDRNEFFYKRLGFENTGIWRMYK